MNDKITVAKTAGFCFGVNRAVELVYNLLEEGKKVCTLGPIIHNPQLVDDLKAKGALIVDSVDQVPEGYTLIIRSHGVAREVFEIINNDSVTFCDATCPFVSKIHKIVDKNTDDNTLLLIAGDENHAEVIGIKGHAKGEVYCFNSFEQLEEILDSIENIDEKHIFVVAQTTFNTKIWEKCILKLKKACTNVKIFDTICDATSERQQEALKLANKNDFMVIVGGRHSSNTKKLFDLCSSITKTVLIETADEINKEDVLSANLIGVTAGASTPAVIIKEVLNTMSDIIENEGTNTADMAAENTMEAVEEKSFDDMTFEEALEASLNNMNSNQKVKGIVVSVNPSEIQVDIGRKYTGIVPANELTNDPSKSPADMVKVGDEIDLIVLKTNDQEGIITLSKRRLDSQQRLVKINEAKETQEILTGTVNAVVKGGLNVVSEGIRIFVPASQATLTRNENLDDLVDTTVEFRVIDIRRRRNIIGSIRSVLKDKKKVAQQAVWDSIEVGNVYNGTVKSLTSYGAFVDIGGVDGMIHITELSWVRIKHPSEVLKEGDLVEVYVRDIDKEKKRISLGYKKTEDNPWEILKSKHSVGDTVTVEIVSFAQYGAFANIIPGVDGLIHISQISFSHVNKPQDFLQIGESVEAKIIDINFDEKRVSLSIKALLDEQDSDDNSESVSDSSVEQETIDEESTPETEVEEATTEPVEVTTEPVEVTTEAEETTTETEETTTETEETTTETEN